MQIHESAEDYLEKILMLSETRSVVRSIDIANAASSQATLSAMTIIAAIGMTREQVYICNVVKCRPPQNRVPLPEEAEACRIHLRMQTYLVRPRVILLLGGTAAQNILGPETRITRDRGKWTERRGVWLMPTFHPSALLRDESKKRDAWEDMQRLRDKLMELHLYEDIYGQRDDP